MSSTTEGAVVIFVDDSPDLALAVAELLAALGYRVIARWANLEGFAGGVFFRGAPDLCIVDLKLGDYSGEQLAREMRAAGATCPIIAMSGDPVRLAAAAATGLFVATIPKPFDGPEFEQTVREAILHGSFLHNPADRVDG